ncbi:mucin-3B-like [Sceloporus undulatus]|uniref:mucin-3B-like n=1 Tax=Sceloporus undulatus TaxID=8520 RepID=UPI001C4B7216|nr:mucin-3B-like [Sceloporus undulatus]
MRPDARPPLAASAPHPRQWAQQSSSTSTVHQPPQTQDGSSSSEDGPELPARPRHYGHGDKWTTPSDFMALAGPGCQFPPFMTQKIRHRSKVLVWLTLQRPFPGRVPSLPALGTMGSEARHKASAISASFLLLLCSLCPSTGLNCLNGGTFDGVKCLCPPYYYGPLCEEGGPPSPPPPSPSSTAAAIKTTTSATVTSPVPCQNGGHRNGSQCVCPPGFWGPLCNSFDARDCQHGGVWAEGACRCSRHFWGPRCQFVENVIRVETEAEAWLDMAVRVPNRLFTDRLLDPSSPDFQDFVQEFVQKVDPIYRKVREYHNMTVLQLRPGSVLVLHRVLLRLPLSARVGEVLQSVSVQLVTALSANVQEQPCSLASDLCFEASSIETSGGSIGVKEGEICGQWVPPGFGPYFSGHPTESGFECLSPCAGGHQAPLDCHYGVCRVPRQGPQCHCPETQASWFLGDRCSGKISKVGLSIGLPLTVSVAVAVALAVVLARK